MQLDLNLLSALDALLDERSVTGAAARLHVSEPAMSRTLGRIRRVTGDPVLVRSGRLMLPTPRALAMQDEVRSLVLRSRAILAPETGIDLATLDRTFTLRCHDALASTLGPVLVRRIGDSAPGVRLRLLGETRDDSSDLGRGVTDLEIGASSTWPAGVTFEHVVDDHLVGVCSSAADTDDPTVDLESYAGAAHVIVSRRGRFEDAVDSALGVQGYRRRVVASVTSTTAALGIVRESGAMLTVPASIASRALRVDGLRVFRLPFLLPPVPVVLAWPTRMTTDQAHSWLRGTVRDAIGDVVTRTSA